MENTNKCKKKKEKKRKEEEEKKWENTLPHTDPTK